MRMARFRQVHSRIIDGERHVWNTERLWTLAADLPVQPIAIDEIPEIDRDCWFGGRPPTIRAVADHCRRIMAADLDLPIILSPDGALMDGGHRIARALMEGVTHLPAVRFETMPPADAIEPA
jgi:hypothetical protein